LSTRAEERRSATAEPEATPAADVQLVSVQKAYLRTALVAGGLLAFALSFDEVIVTTFTAGSEQTLPLWILQNLSRPNQLPIINVVAILVILLSALPVYLAQRLTSETAVLGSR